MNSSDNILKSEPLGMYCRISLFPFSMAPFCHDAYESAKYTVVSSFFAFFMAGELTSVVCCDSQYVFLVKHE